MTKPVEKLWEDFWAATLAPKEEYERTQRALLENLFFLADKKTITFMQYEVWR